MPPSSPPSSSFAGRVLVIATMHGKERAIAPALQQALGVTCVVAEGLDTDALGTFTGEVERELDPVSAAREKCRRAMALTGCDIAVASEGSFGPHPSMFFVPADEEVLVLLDGQADREFVVREVSTATNFAAAELKDRDALLDFAARAGFPEHGLILRRSREDNSDMHKGITAEDTLLALFDQLLALYGVVTVETDMRAHLNPQRMAVIEAATEKLVELLASACPDCGLPGFTVRDVVRGLPCAACRLPTESPSRLIYRCDGCGCEQQRGNPDGKRYEDPMYCPYCNP